MQLQQLGLSGYGYSPSPSSAGAGSAGGALSPSSGGATERPAREPPAGATGSVSSQAASALGPTSNVAELADVRESESLDFQMADGTEVSIRMRAHATALGASQTQADGTTSSAAALIANGRLQIEVHGNLSNDDLNAISQVVSQVDSLATQFFSGDVQDAFAAAASLNTDPAQIASFSLKLSYSSELFQQATANASSASASASASAASATPAAAPGSTPAAQTTPNTSTGGSGAAPSASPQQIIINFVQQAMTKLRVSSSGSHEHFSSRWKVKLLAQALPAYAQAQATGATALAGTTSDATAQASTTSPSDTGAPANTGTPAGTGTPAAASPVGASSQPSAAAQTAAAPQPTAGATPLQAARLAAATLNHLAAQ